MSDQKCALYIRKEAAGTSNCETPEAQVKALEETAAGMSLCFTPQHDTYIEGDMQKQFERMCAIDLGSAELHSAILLP